MSWETDGGQWWGKHDELHKLSWLARYTTAAAVAVDTFMHCKVESIIWQIEKLFLELWQFATFHCNKNQFKDNNNLFPTRKLCTFSAL